MDSPDAHGRGHRVRIATICFVAIVVAVVVVGPTGMASGRDQVRRAEPDAPRELAIRHAPFVATIVQTDRCGSGEPFRPVRVESVLGRADVVLRNRDGDVVARAPRASDLYQRGPDLWLDLLAGRALDPGCDYERWFVDSGGDLPLTVYARVVTEPGIPDRLAVQYWMFFPFNDWNNRHEGDWEMIQLNFEVGTIEAALAAQPFTVGYAQHVGAERADWSGDKLERRGAHPVVYTATGSHASYYGDAVYLGHSGDEGFGCDITAGATIAGPAEVVMLPDRVDDADDEFAWLTYSGRWGERNRGPNDGPTGPNTTPRYTTPITWSEHEWRSSSAVVPRADDAGARATGMFCSAARAGSWLYTSYLRAPWLWLTAAGVSMAGLAVLVRRTSWRPIDLVDLDRARPAGAILRTSVALYRQHFRPMAMIGLPFVPLGLLTSIVLSALVQWTSVGHLTTITEQDPVLGAIVVLAFGAIGSLATTVLVHAVAANAVDQLRHGAQIRILDCYRSTLEQRRSLKWGSVLITGAVMLGGVTIIGLPLVLVYVSHRSLFVPAIVFEHRSARHAFRQSRQLVRRRRRSMIPLVAVINALAIGSGALVGFAAIVFAPVSLRVANAATALVYAIAIPWAGVALALAYLSIRTADEAPVSATHPVGVMSPHPDLPDDEDIGEPDGFALTEEMK